MCVCVGEVQELVSITEVQWQELVFIKGAMAVVCVGPLQELLFIIKVQ